MQSSQLKDLAVELMLQRLVRILQFNSKSSIIVLERDDCLSKKYEHRSPVYHIGPRLRGGFPQMYIETNQSVEL